ncbi:MAG: sulfur carrier protein ThiS [Desulfobacteraceae bacterium]
MRSRLIDIQVNGLTERVAEGAAIAGLVGDHSDGDPHLIVERNGRFVYPASYDETRVEPGDEIELIHPDFGG